MAALLIAALVALPACTAPPAEQEEEEEEERTTGPYLDEIIITEELDHAQAIFRLQTDDLDLFSYGLANPDLYQTVLGDQTLTHVASLGSYNEFTFNPVGPVFDGTGKLNPFSVKEFREAMNWLVDRDYIIDEIMGGLGAPRYTAISSGGLDSQRYATQIAALEAEYAYDPARATAVIDSVMTDLGATKADGQWMYNGEQVEIIGLIRTEDERLPMGDYFANLLEDQGFAVTRNYGISAVLWPDWTGDPNRGVFHYYTGGWVQTEIPLDEGDGFSLFYTTLGWPGNPLWDAYDPDPALYDAAEKLLNLSYASMDEREDLFEVALTLGCQDSARAFLVDRASFSPMQTDVRVAHDSYASVYGCWIWAPTAHFIDEAGDPIIGGTMRVGTSGILTQPWNPIVGSNWVYDLQPIRATADLDTYPDTRTGLRWPHRLEKAEVFFLDGLPVQVTNTDWCSLTFLPEIQVPLDAWSDWDAVNQRFLTVQDRFGSEGTTARRLTKQYYPTDIFELPLHDGSTLSVGDFVMRAIIEFDRAKPESALYDDTVDSWHASWLPQVKGFKFITDDPDYGLIIEFYSDKYYMNAERASYYDESSVLGWPEYDYGTGMWHTITLGIMAEEAGELAFSQDKSDTLEVEWTSFISGPSIPILKDKLDEALADSYIPYFATMGEFVTTAEAAERWTNLSAFYDDFKHFWVGSGPFYLYKAFTTERVIQLRRFEDYQDPIGSFDSMIQMP
jgi:peptide/nickel transport system substrate-binding protein